MSTGGWSRTRLRRMREVMAGYVERGEIPGLVALVSRRGEVHVFALGVKTIGGRGAAGGNAAGPDATGRNAAGEDAAGGDAVRRDTIFRISSMTKPVTAAAAMILVEECKVRLDEPVDRLLPELSSRQVLKRLDGPLGDTVPAHRPITVRDLLTFRLGFGQMPAAPDAVPILKAANELSIGMGPPAPAAVPAPDEWMRRLGTLPLMHQPGERWLYHTGSDVLGVLIARAAGQPLDTFLRERLFEPLGMKDTAFSVPAQQLHRFGPSYWTPAPSGAAEVYDEALGGQWSRPPAFPSGGGGLVSTADDFLAFGRMLLNKGRHGRRRILSRPTVETMMTDQLTPAQKSASGLVPGAFVSRGWGFGMAVVTHRVDPAAPVGQVGWDGGLGTSWRSDPGEGLVAILMTQRMWTSARPPPVTCDFLTSAYQALDD